MHGPSDNRPPPAAAAAAVGAILRRSQSPLRTRDVLARPPRVSNVDDRAFGVAAARVRNSQPPDVTASPSLSVFKRPLKTSLFDV